MKKNLTNPGYDTVQARQAIANKLNLPYQDDMQDWPWEVAQPDDMEAYIKQYDITTDQDELVVLMEMMLQSINEQTLLEKFDKYWTEVELRLEKNFHVHQSSVYYWCCWDVDDVKDYFQVTPYIRKLWNKENIKNKL